MNYKKIIKNRELRFKILNMLSWIPDKQMIKIQYRIKTGRKLNLDNPKRFTEKLQWYKLNYRNPIMHQCVDKYEVRKYVSSKGLKNILVECYGVYNTPDEIDFHSLPNKFVIKTTSGSGGQNIIICQDKNNLDITETKKKLNLWLKQNPKKSFGREWAYEGTKNKIIIEKYLYDKNNLGGIPVDYKFFCFNGKVEYIFVDYDRYVSHKRNIYDKDWNYLDIYYEYEKLGDKIKKPTKLTEMKQVAERLSREFPFVRVDLYCIDNTIYFGELTFYPSTGYLIFEPDNFDYEIGKNFKLEGWTINDNKNN